MSAVSSPAGLVVARSRQESVLSPGSAALDRPMSAYRLADTVSAASLSDLREGAAAASGTRRATDSAFAQAAAAASLASAGTDTDELMPFDLQDDLTDVHTRSAPIFYDDTIRTLRSTDLDAAAAALRSLPMAVKQKRPGLGACCVVGARNLSSDIILGRGERGVADTRGAAAATAHRA
jgi:hypothetical protein